MATPLVPANEQAVLLARYTENATQARHHEQLRERATAVVAQTTGVVLGLVGFKDNALRKTPFVLTLALFIVVLGLWGLFASLSSEARARRHRDRIDTFLAQLDPAFNAGAKSHELNFVWIAFHISIVVLGVSLWLFAS